MRNNTQSNATGSRRLSREYVAYRHYRDMMETYAHTTSHASANPSVSSHDRCVVHRWHTEHGSYTGAVHCTHTSSWYNPGQQASCACRAHFANGCACVAAAAAAKLAAAQAAALAAHEAAENAEAAAWVAGLPQPAGPVAWRNGSLVPVAVPHAPEPEPEYRAQPEPAPDPQPNPAPEPEPTHVPRSSMIDAARREYSTMKNPARLTFEEVFPQYASRAVFREWLAGDAGRDGGAGGEPSANPLTAHAGVHHAPHTDGDDDGRVLEGVFADSA